MRERYGGSGTSFMRFRMKIRDDLNGNKWAETFLDIVQNVPAPQLP